MGIQGRGGREALPPLLWRCPVFSFPLIPPLPHPSSRGSKPPCTQDQVWPPRLAKARPAHPASSLTMLLTLSLTKLLIDSYRGCYFRPLST